MSKRPSRYWVDANIKRLKTHDIVRVEMTSATRDKLQKYKIINGFASYDAAVNMMLSEQDIS